MSTVGRRFFGGIVAVLAGLALAFQFPTSAYAADVDIDATNFPDATFRSYVAYEFDTNEDGALQQDELDAVEEIAVQPWSSSFSLPEVKSLQGVEYFANLKSLSAGRGRLSHVDLSKNLKLRYLDLAFNQLSSLDLSANTALEELWLTDSGLSSLDLPASTALRILQLEKNQLTSIDLSGNPALRTLNLDDNQLTAIDLSANTELQDLDLYNNQLTAIDLSANTLLDMPSLGDKTYGGQKRTVILPGGSRLVPVNQLSAGFDAGKVIDLKGAAIVNGRLKVNEGVDTVTYSYQSSFAGVHANDPDKLPTEFTQMLVTLKINERYTVSFDMGGHGDYIADQSVDKGKLATAPTAPSAEGWEFKGWFTDDTFATPFDFTAPINADVTVYAKWEEAAGEPTGEPTTDPTGNPTGEPTTDPTGNPTGEPTTDPTGNPTGEPTTDPSGKATAKPSGKSTATPTNQPNEVTPEGSPITGVNSSWIALLGAAAITAGGLLLLRRRA